MSDSEKDLVIATLTKRLSALEAEVRSLKAASPGVPEDVLVAVRFAPSPNWVRQGRRALQNHSIR